MDPWDDKESNAVKRFIDKPMAETTVGDTLIMHAGVAFISIGIGLTVQGLLSMFQNSLRKGQHNQ